MEKMKTETALFAAASLAAFMAAASVIPVAAESIRANADDGGEPISQTLRTPKGKPGRRAAPGGLISPGGRQLDLENCVPSPNCMANGKPCYLEIAQGDPIVSLIGLDGGGSPVQQKAAYRIRLCTEQNDPVCQDTSANQRLNYNVFNYANAADPYVLALQLSTDSGVLDTGPYQQLGPHNFFGVVCLKGQEPCRIAWQYCELPPNDPGTTQ